MLNMKLRRESSATEVTEPEPVSNQLQITTNRGMVRKNAHASKNQLRVSVLLESVQESNTSLTKSSSCEFCQDNLFGRCTTPPAQLQPPVESNLHVFTDLSVPPPPIPFRSQSMPLFTQYPVELTSYANHSDSDHIYLSSSRKSPNKVVSLHQNPLQEGTNQLSSDLS